MLDHALRLADKAWGENYPLLVLVDLNRLGKSTPSSRSASLHGLKTLSFFAVAVISRSLFARQLAKLVIRASGRGNQVRVFSDKPMAIDWLRNLLKPAANDPSSKNGIKSVESARVKEK